MKVVEVAKAVEDNPETYQRKKYSTYESIEKEYKFKRHGYGKDKQSISYGKIFENITTQTQATYEHGANITWSIENKDILRSIRF